MHSFSVHPAPVPWSDTPRRTRCTPVYTECICGTRFRPRSTRQRRTSVYRRLHPQPPKKIEDGRGRDWEGLKGVRPFPTPEPLETGPLLTEPDPSTKETRPGVLRYYPRHGYVEEIPPEERVTRRISRVFVSSVRSPYYIRYGAPSET